MSGCFIYFFAEILNFEFAVNFMYELLNNKLLYKCFTTLCGLVQCSKPIMVNIAVLDL